MAHCFFEATQAFMEENSRLFNFINSATVGLWNLRLDVGAYVAACPDASSEDLHGRFVAGSKVHGANLRQTCLSDTWEANRERLAELALVVTVANFEAWCDGLCLELGLHERNAAGMQFAVGNPRKKAPHHYADVLASGGPMATSNDLQECFHATLACASGVDASMLEARMLCFRYFKEVRNALAHALGVANQVTFDAYSKFHSVADATRLGVNEVPTHEPVTVGAAVRPVLRGVIGFSAIVRYLVLTLDMECARTQAAEKVLAARWRRRFGTKAVILPGDEKRRHRRLRSMAREIGLPAVAAVSVFYSFLKRVGLVA